MTLKHYCHPNTLAQAEKAGHVTTTDSGVTFWSTYGGRQIIADSRIPDDGRFYFEDRDEVRNALESGDATMPRGPHYDHDRWHALITQSLAEIRKLGELKGGEYAGDTDRLANFRRNGERLGLPMETVWGVYAGKHWDAISQFIIDSRNGKDRERLEPIHGRVDDLLVYLLLFKAMLDERGLLPTAE